MGPVLGPHARIDRTRDTRVAEPWLPAPEDGRPGEGQRLTPGAPHNGGRHPPPGTPFRHPHSEQRQPARAHAVGPVLDPHARIDRTRHTRVAEPWPPAPEDGRPEEGQRLTPGAPNNGGRHPPRGRSFRHPHSEQRRPARAHSVGPVLHPHARIDRTRDTRVAEPRLPAPEDGRPVEGQRLTPGAPLNFERHPPGTPLRHPHSEQRRPARSHAVGPVLGPHARTDRARDTRVAEPWLPAPEDGQPGEGQRLTPGAPHNGGRHPPPGDALPPPPQRATPARKGARCGAGAGSTRPHRPHPGHTGRGTLAARSRGRAVGRGTAPDTRRPSQRWKAPPPGTPFRHPHSEQRRPARAHAVGPVLGPHARIDRTRDTRVAEPWLPAPEDGRSGEGQRLTPGALHNGGRHPPRGHPSAGPTASNAGPQGRTLWGRCWVHTPASTAPGTHGSRNPGCPLQRTGGRGRDSA